MIDYRGNTWHIQGRSYSYVMVVSPEGDLFNFHYGEKIGLEDYAADFDLYRADDRPYNNGMNLNAYPQEYPSFGHQDLREPALEITNKFGNMLTQMKVKSHRILKGVAAEVKGMPCLYGSDADTLEITRADEAVGIEVRLSYVVFDDLDTLGRSAVIINRSGAPMELSRAFSFNVDFPEDDYDAIWFQGDWGRERWMERCPVHRSARMDISDTSGRGSRWVNPFVMLAQRKADEDTGIVYGFNLIYSINHTSIVEADTTGRVRVQQGICPKGFRWTLQDGEQFQTPQAILCFSNAGMGEMSRQFHKVMRNHLMRSKYTHAYRPILINNWEATRFDFTQDQIVSMAKVAKTVDVDMFVLDDGWFGARNDARAGLGDWVVNKKKLPLGIEGLAKAINDMGLKFGLWFEPEMVNPDSDCFRAHPEWVVRGTQLEPVVARGQLVLDLSKPQVCDFIIDAVSKVLDCGLISYVKWDMNKEISDAPYPGFHHAYVLGLYRVMKTLADKYPDILFEGCASGGGRFDAGVLTYMPQIWTSDNTDAVSRLKIQYSTSMCYPLSSISAHVTAVPNKQTGRLTTLKTRADVAYAGVFGYELDITKTTEEEREIMREQIQYERHIQSLIHNGDFYRLRSPYEGSGNECAWSVVGEDRVFLMAIRLLTVVNRHRYQEPNIKLRGLDENASYRDVATGKVYSGSFLMHRGIRPLYPVEDFTTLTFEFEKI